MAPSVAAADTHPGFSDSLSSKPKVPGKAAPAKNEMLVLNTIRCLAADLCQEVSLSPSICAEQLLQRWPGWVASRLDSVTNVEASCL